MSYRDGGDGGDCSYSHERPCLWQKPQEGRRLSQRVRRERHAWQAVGARWRRVRRATAGECAEDALISAVVQKESNGEGDDDDEERRRLHHVSAKDT